MVLPLSYIAGFVEGFGSFLWVNQKGREIPVFQLKAHIDQKDVLENIKKTLKLGESLHYCGHNGRNYGLLLVRSRKTILDKIIPTFEGRLCGKKQKQFNDWKIKFLRMRLEWKYK